MRAYTLSAILYKKHHQLQQISIWDMIFSGFFILVLLIFLLIICFAMLKYRELKVKYLQTKGKLTGVEIGYSRLSDRNRKLSKALRRAKRARKKNMTFSTTDSSSQNSIPELFLSNLEPPDGWQDNPCPLGNPIDLNRRTKTPTALSSEETGYSSDSDFDRGGVRLPDITLNQSCTSDDLLIEPHIYNEEIRLDTMNKPKASEPRKGIGSHKTVIPSDCDSDSHDYWNPCFGDSGFQGTACRQHSDFSILLPRDTVVSTLKETSSDSSRFLVNGHEENTLTDSITAAVDTLFERAILTTRSVTEHIHNVLPSDFENISSFTAKRLYFLDKELHSESKLIDIIYNASKEMHEPKLLLKRFRNPPKSLHQKLKLRVEEFDILKTRFIGFCKNLDKIRQKVCRPGWITEEEILLTLGQFNEINPRENIFVYKDKFEKLIEISNIHPSKEGHFILNKLLPAEIKRGVEIQLVDTVMPEVESVWQILLKDFGKVCLIIDKIKKAHEQIGKPLQLSGRPTRKNVQRAHRACLEHLNLMRSVELIASCSNNLTQDVICYDYIQTIQECLPKDEENKACSLLASASRIAAKEPGKTERALQYEYMKQCYIDAQTQAEFLLTWYPLRDPEGPTYCSPANSPLCLPKVPSSITTDFSFLKLPPPVPPLLPVRCLCAYSRITA